MKKKIHPLSVLFVIVGIVGILFACFFTYKQQIPGALIILGCSLVMFVFPSMFNGSAQTNSDYDTEEPDVAPKPKKKSVLIGTFKGRVRMPDRTSNDCTLQVSTGRLDFVSDNGQKLLGMQRSAIKNVAMPNSHMIVLTVGSDDYRFISSDAGDVQHIYKILTRPVQG